jgi:putative membrane protein
MPAARGKLSGGVLAWTAVFGAVLTWSAIAPGDRSTWWMEVAPALLGFVVLAVTRERFPLTRLCYGLILLHACILMVGGHYTYAQVPLGEWLSRLTGDARNNYDKLGHFAQGFVPAIVAREILVRNGVLAVKGWLAFIVVCIALAISASYELVEWIAAEISAEGSAAFLGTQGYAWDTQSDMAWALCGAIVALLSLSRLHDRQIREMI